MPKPIASPARGPPVSVRRMHSMPIGPTGAAIARPTPAEVTKRLAVDMGKPWSVVLIAQFDTRSAVITWPAIDDANRHACRGYPGMDLAAAVLGHNFPTSNTQGAPVHVANRSVTLRLFIAVCEEGTIARAAEREFIAPSAVSKRLADLEALVDVALLSRSQRG